MERKREGSSDQDIEAAWSKEIERRVAEIDAGTVDLVSWEEVRAELFSPIATENLSRP
jgi:putative addiction module component (TIGR02574 family)